MDDSGELNLENQADATVIQRSAAQTRHLVDFFQQGYWGNPAESDLYYHNYQLPSATAVSATEGPTADASVAGISTASNPVTRTASSASRAAENTDSTSVRKADGNSADRRHFPVTVQPSASTPTVAELQRQGSKTRIPIFIVGFFRSGSTLLEGLLESHSSFHGDDGRSNAQSAEDSADNDREQAESHSAAEALGFRHKAIWGMGEDSPFVFEMYAMQEETLAAYADLEKQKQDLAQAEQQQKPGSKIKRKAGKKTVEALEQDFVAAYRQIVDKKASTIVGKMLQRYQHFHGPDIVSTSNNTCTTPADAHNMDTPHPLRIVDKMLTNYVNIGLIHLVFPRAIILHTVRDPLDTLFSCYANRFGDPSAAYTLHLQSLVSKYVHYLEVMQHFRSVLPHYSLPVMRVKYNSTAEGGGMKAMKTTRRIQALVDVRYEELVANPERTLQHLLENVLGVPYAPSVRAMSISEVHSADENDNITVGSTAAESKVKDPYVRVVQTASRLQVKQPVYHSSVGRWRKYAAQLQDTLISALRAHLPRLASLQVLPYLAHNSSLGNNSAGADSKASAKDSKKCKGRSCVFMNWALDPKFDYDGMLQQLK